MLKNVWFLLNDQVDVPESHILHLCLTGQQGDQGWGELLRYVGEKVSVLAHHCHVLHHDLDI